MYILLFKSVHIVYSDGTLKRDETVVSGPVKCHPVLLLSDLGVYTLVQFVLAVFFAII